MNTTAGRYFHVGWEVGVPDEPLAARIASLHEFGHAALNSSTAWGVLTQSLALAEGGAPGPRLTSVVAASRLCHEAFATSVSISTSGDEDRARFFSESQSGYARYLAIADSLAEDPHPGWSARYDRHNLSRAALTACMQSPALRRFLEIGPTEFTLAAIPSRDWPDRRLRALRSAKTLWRSPPSGDTPADGGDILVNHVCRALRSAGHPSMSPTEYREGFAAVARLLNTELPEPVDADDNARLGLPGLFGLESIRLRSPLEARIEGFDRSLPPTLAFDPARDPEGVLVVVRSRVSLNQQYNVLEDVGSATNDPVIGASVPVRSSSGHTERLRLLELSHPGQLEQLTRRFNVSVCVSYSTLRQGDWFPRWSRALSEQLFVTCLLDSPLAPVLDAWLTTGASVRMGLASGLMAQNVAVVFRIDGSGLVLLPITEASVFGITTFVERRSDGAVQVDDDVLGDDEVVRVARILDHLASTDSVRSMGVPMQGLAAPS